MLPNLCQKGILSYTLDFLSKGEDEFKKFEYLFFFHCRLL